MTTAHAGRPKEIYCKIESVVKDNVKTCLGLVTRNKISGLFLLTFTYSHSSVSENTLVTSLTLAIMCSTFQDKVNAKSIIILQGCI